MIDSILDYAENPLLLAAGIALIVTCFLSLVLVLYKRYKRAKKEKIANVKKTIHS